MHVVYHMLEDKGEDTGRIVRISFRINGWIIIQSDDQMNK